MIKTDFRGFTLAEFTIMFILICLISAVLLVEAGRLIRRSNEGLSKANLGIIRIAIMNYYSTHNGQWPPEPLPYSLVPEFLTAVPYLNINHHPRTNEVKGSTIADTGCWSYNPVSGNFRIDCTHRDLEGVPLSSW